MTRPRAALSLLAALALAGCGADATERSAQRVSGTVATNLEVPWGIAFLPNGDALVSQRDRGTIVRIPRRGRKRVVMRVAGADFATGEGGLLGLAVSPRYRRDRFVYAYVTTASDNRIVRFRLGGRVRPILTGIPRGNVHDGGRLAFGPDGLLYAGTGDASNSRLAQQRDSLAGKVLRMTRTGKVPRGNPFPGSVSLVLRAPQRPGARVRPRRPAVGERAGPGPLRRGQPHPQGAQLRLAGGRGPRPDAQRALHEPEGHLADRRRVAERRRRARPCAVRRRARRRGAVARPAARRPYGPPASPAPRAPGPAADGRPRARRRAVARDLQPRRPRRPGAAGRQDPATAVALHNPALTRSARVVEQRHRK
jgi:hypothetical protein